MKDNINPLVPCASLNQAESLGFLTSLEAQDLRIILREKMLIGGALPTSWEELLSRPKVIAYRKEIAHWRELLDNA